jgi:prepilin-type N-terminal cleavage/methylation domain-containing protein
MIRAWRQGFSLLETMIVVAIVAVLATIALPSYAVYVKRAHILEAVADLSNAHARMEEYFLDQRSYIDGRGLCGVPAPTAAAADAFVLTCAATADTFTYTATGNAGKGMDDFVYTIDHLGARVTLALPPRWSRTADCWTIRADGSCA